MDTSRKLAIGLNGLVSAVNGVEYIVTGSSLASVLMVVNGAFAVILWAISD